jgi:hypothetical protein
MTRSALRLYKVTFPFTTYVAAETADDAEDTARRAWTRARVSKLQTNWNADFQRTRVLLVPSDVRQSLEGSAYYDETLYEPGQILLLNSFKPTRTVRVALK